ncbi:amino acid adenylation domain-containing protein [Micromonospora aurantiaca (nom. illeg.)]|uniref:amino acid adenylation domain-containing protein n=1 Tax=Micromonospora aurantiaca (nom. illeg.) TaxID=47850 RepID=UPI0033D51B69
MSWIMRSLVRNAQLYPQRAALVAEDATLTYSVLVRRVASAAAEMQRCGVLDGEITAIALRRGTPQIIAALAAMWLGSPFAIVDLDEAPERRRAQVRASLATRLVVEQGADAAYAAEGVPTLRISTSGDTGPGPELAWPDDDDVAYVVFTSGTTGVPKSVAVPHRALGNYSRFLSSVLDQVRPAGAPLSCASVTSFATDLGHTAIFPALVSGDTVHLVDKPTMMDPLAFGSYMRAHSVDVLKSTASHMSAHLDHGARDVLPRTLMIFGGEPLSWDLVDQVAQNGTCRVLNHYGPSETTIGVLTYPVDPRRQEHRSSAHVPLGKPIDGVSVEVVGEELRAVPPGETGELLVWGECVALGYLGARDATRARFVTLPSWLRSSGGGAQPVVAYRTGDTVRRLASGDIEFLGRNDRQVKINGQRIELGEVEAALRRCPDVRNAVVVHHSGTGLSAFVVPADPASPPDTKSLRSRLREELSVSAIPRVITVLDHIPLTLSGKLDATKLALVGDRASSVIPIRRGVN